MPPAAELLEDRTLLAIGPSLVAITANTGEFIHDGDPTLHEAPRELVFQFSPGQVIDPATLGGIQITRSGFDGVFDNGNDVVVQPGFIGIGESPNHVVARFASHLPDDLYRIQIFGSDQAPAFAVSDFNTNGAVEITLTAAMEGAAGNGISLVVTRSNHGAPSAPIISVTGRTITANLNLNTGNQSTAQDLIDAINNHAGASALVTASVSAGNANTNIASPAINYSPLVLDGAVTAVTNSQGDAFEDGGMESLEFRLDLGAQILAVVPQPVSRDENGALTQARDQIVVHFNQDKLDPDSAQDPTFYQLIDTKGTLDTSDDELWVPIAVNYNDEDDTVTLQFQTDLPSGYFRLQVGSPSLTTGTLMNPAVNDDNSSFGTATQVGPLGSSETFTSAVINSSISPQFFVPLPAYPGGADEPGHRNIPPESHIGGADTNPAITTRTYHFPATYGVDPQGNTLFNQITENQKQRAREVFEIYSYYAGIQFVESTSGLAIVTGDPRALSPTIPPTAVGGIANAGMAIMNGFLPWGDSEYGGAWFRTALHEIGHSLGLGHSYELPSIQGPGISGEPIFPGDHDLVHLRRIHRPDSTDIDMFRFSVTETGWFTAEIVAERMQFTSLLDSALRLFRETEGPGGTLIRDEIAFNEGYFSKDAFIRLYLDEPGTYYVGVSSKGNTDYNPTVSNTGYGGTTQGAYELRLDFTPDPDIHLVDLTGTPIDGNADGKPGGTFDFWFHSGNTIFVDKAADTVPGPQGSGTLANPYDNIQSAVAAAAPGDIIRIVGNVGLELPNGELRTPATSLPYLIGVDANFNPLADGRNVEVPQGVTMMIDAGAVIKMAGSVIDVGSSAQGVPRDGGALQVLGTPGNNVYFTSYANDALGGDSDGVSDGPSAGDWGGLVFRSDSDHEHAGIFLNFVNHAHMTYGGGRVFVDSVEESFAPIHLVEARPTIKFNTITRSADAAISADPNSFDDSLNRIGPDIYGNQITDNSINGLFIRIRTQFGRPVDRLEVSARWDDWDIVHVVSENLQIAGNAGGPVGTNARTSGRLAIDPGVVVKLDGARIEAEIGSANLIAEGTPGNPVIFTSLQDDRFGGIGTFDTTNNGGATVPQPGDWGGLIFNAASRGSIDHALIAYGGGRIPIFGTFDQFNAIEIRQADVRIANSQIEYNAPGQSNTSRNGRGATTAATIFVQGAQPIIVNNVIQHNQGPALSINANALQSRVLRDRGRSTGLRNAFGEFDANRGPLVRLNRLQNNSINGMIVRGAELTTETIWDDTDIVHVLFNEILILNHHTFSGLRLQSSPSESLVVKLFGPNAGFTANGTPLDIIDRIGGTIQVVGFPGAPVVFTSLEDHSVGAGLNPAGFPQNDTAGIGAATAQLLYSGLLAHGGVQPNQESELAEPQGLAASQAAIIHPLVGEIQHHIVTVNDPDDYIVDPGIGMDGVARLSINFPGASALCTGTLLSTGRHVLTAAHCLTDDVGNFIANSATATFILPGGEQPVPVSQFFVHPDWDGDVFNGHDIAILELVTEAPVAAERYDIYRGSDEVGQIFEKVGYGRTGTGNTGHTLPAGVRRGGENRYDALGDIFDNFFVAAGTMNPGTQLAFDFDNGLPANDAFGMFFGLVDLGQGDLEITSAPGDSGGPSFINGQVVGVTSYGFGFLGAPDVLAETNASYGEIAVDMRVSYYQDWIDGILDGSTPSAPTTPAEPGDWRSIRLDRYSNDRNVALIQEVEPAVTGGTGVDSNRTPGTAQFLGNLAPNEKSGDDVRRLGFEIHGHIALDNSRDVDVYSFTADAGTEVWFDIDRTAGSLDTVLELVRADGLVLARSINNNTLSGLAQPMMKHAYLGGDFYSTNSSDAGMRVVLPGTPGVTGTYFIRVRSNTAPGDIENLNGGLTTGEYQLQIRLRQVDEFPGSTVRNADIRYATNGIEIYGLPAHSPLLGEAAEWAAPNNTFAQAQPLGNLLTTDRNVISVAGSLSGANDVDWYSFELGYEMIQAIGGVNAGGKTFATIFDIDYADGLTRADTILSVFDSQGRLIMVSRDSNIEDDQPAPGQGANTDDLTRGSVGKLDPFIGPQQMPAGGPGSTETYYLAISSNAQLPTALNGTFQTGALNPMVRLEPINSIQRIVEDHIGFQGFNSGGNTIAPTTQIFDISNAQALSTHVRPFDLSDVVLYVSTGTRLWTVDPLNGQVMTDVGSLIAANRTSRDIHIRSDGRMFTYDAGVNQDNQAGRLREIDPGNAAEISTTGDNIPNFNANTNPPDPNQITTNQVDAFAFRRSGVTGTAVQFNQGLFYSVRDGNQSRLYQANPDTGSAAAAQNTPYGRRGTFITGPGVSGLTTGMVFHGNTLYGVSNQGHFYTINTINAQATLIRHHPGMNFQGLTVGPQNLEGGAYRNMLFAITNNGELVAMDRFSGQLQPVFAGTNQIQELSVTGNPTAGSTFTLTFNNGFGGVETTGPIPFNAPAEVSINQIQRVAVSGTPTGGDFTLTFDNGQGSVQATLPIAYNAPNLNNIEEVQELSLSGAPDGGTFTLTFDGQTTVPIPYNAPGADSINEIQRIEMTGNPTGNFRLIFNGNPTALIPFNADAATVQAALEGLAQINPGDVIVTGGVLPGTPIDVEFAGQFTGSDVPEMTVDASGLAGGTVDVATTRTSILGVRHALEALSNINPGDLLVTGGALPGTPVAIQFTGQFSGADVVQIVADGSGLTGGAAPDAAVTTIDDGVFSVRHRLEQLSNINPGDIIITGGPLPGGALNIEFAGQYAGLNMPLMTADASNLTGGTNPDVNVTQFRTAVISVRQALEALTLINPGDLSITGGSLPGTPVSITFVGQYAGQNIPLMVVNNTGMTNGLAQIADGGTAGGNSISIGLNGATGLAFSPLDFNLWHPTMTRGNDAGHGINPAFDNSRTRLTNVTHSIPDGRQQTEAQGGASFHFGLEQWVQNPVSSNTYIRYNTNGQYGVLPGGLYNIQQDLTTNPNIGNNYNVPGGAHGSLISDPFSLAGYHRNDKPTLYFNYFLETQGAQGTTSNRQMRDSARVFVSADGGNTWQLVATNNAARSTAGTSNNELPAYPTTSRNESPMANQRVQELFDNTGTWRQARIDLADFAGQGELMLRFDFATAGAMAEFGLPGNATGNINNAQRGQQNQFEGFYIDDIIVGFAERGEMVTGAQTNQTAFFGVPQNPDPMAPAQSLQGPYQLEIRRGTEYVAGMSGVGNPINDLEPDVMIFRQFDTNARFIRDTSLNQPSITESFETGDLSALPWVTYGDQPWSVTTTSPNSGTFSAQSGPITHNQSSTLELTMNVPAGSISFARRVSSEAFFDFLIFSINGVERERVAGNIPYTTVSFPISAGTHTFTWTYEKDFSVNSFLDTVFIDDIVFSSGATIVGGIGDQNVHREQGHVQIENNIIRNSSQWGIIVDAGQRDPGTNLAHPGSVRNLPVLNTQRLAPGVTVVNNVVAGSGQGGIRFSGDANTSANVPLAAVPFGRIINNTIYGGPVPAGVGIRVDDNASPTLLNNIVANTGMGISIDGTSGSTIVGTSLFQGNANNGTAGTNAITLAPSEPLFVNPATGNFYLASGSRAIDSALNSLADRPNITAVKSAVGIPASPIFAPDRDLYGQLRVDDPDQDPPPGLGSNIFKDRGAVERADFIGGTARLVVPEDNGSADLDPANHIVWIDDSAFVTQFAIELNDVGVGIDPATVTSARFALRRNDVLLVDGVDYFFVYNPNTRRAIFTAFRVFDLNNRYTITVDNTLATGVKDLAGNRLQANQTDGSTVFTILLTSGQNNPPVNSVPDSQTVNEDSVLVFSTARGNLISVSDPDAFLGDNRLQVTLTAEILDATYYDWADLSLTALLSLNPAALGALTFSVGDGVADQTMTFTGTIPDLNAALSGLSFTPPPDYFGPATLTITTNDLGNFGSPGNTGPQETTDVIEIDVLPVNDPPSFTLAGDPPTIDEDAGPQTLVGFASNVSPGPPNESDQEVTFVLTIDSATSNLAFSSGPAIDAVTGDLTYTAASFTNGTAIIRVTLVDDGPGNPPHNNTSAPQFFTINVNAINNAPTFTLLGDPPGVDQDAGLQTVVGFISDVLPGPPQATDELDQQLSIDVTVVDTTGTLAFSSPPDINLTTGTLTYTSAPNTWGTALVAVTITDDGPDVPPHENSATQFFTITVNWVNDPPVAVTGAYVMDEGDVLQLDGSASFDIDEVLGSPFGDQIVSYEWDLNNNGQFDDATGVAPEVSWSTLVGLGLQIGENTIALRVTDSFDASHTTTTTVTILAVDYGDAPDSYQTLKANNGAAHTIVPGFHLGATVINTTDGQPGIGADADAGDDGVTFNTSLETHATEEMSAHLTIIASAAGKLDAWIDFNQNGTFDASEHLFGGTSYDLVAGVNVIEITIPAGLPTGSTYARFRFSSAGGLAPFGRADDGEVEDYQVDILPVQAPIVPTVTAPAGPQTTDFTPTFAWIAPGSDPFYRYDLVVTNSSGQTVISESNLSSLSFTATSNLAAGTYQVRVRSHNRAGDVSAFSTPYEITVVPMTVTGPAGVVIDATPTITWNAVLGTSRYVLTVDNVTNGTTTVIQQDNLTTTSFTPSSELMAGTYRVVVQAFDADGLPGEPSVPFNFTIVRPTLTGPTNTTNQTPPTFTWNAIPGAARYEIWVDNTTTGERKVIFRNDVTTNSFTPANVLPEGNYRFWIRAFAGAGADSAGVWSLPLDFTIFVPAPAAPTVNVPSLPSMSRFPTISWSTVTFGVTYELNYIYVTASGTINETIPGITTTTFTPTTPFPAGNYEVQVRVRAYNAVAKAGAWSPLTTLRVNTNQRPTLNVPASNNFGRPLLTWTAIPGAERYDLWVRNLTTGADQVIRQENLTTNSFMPSAPLPDGEYRFWVRAFNSTSDGGPWSLHQDFTSVITTSLIQPVGNTSFSRPTLSWQAIDGAARYDLWVRNLTTGQDQVIRQQNLTGTSFTATTPLPNGTYQVWVRAFNAQNQGGNWSPTHQFTITSTAKPVVTGPESPTRERRPTITWDPFSGAVRYDLWVDNLTTGERQVIRNTNVQDTSYRPTTPLTPLNDAAFRVWVRAFDGQGNASAWSQAFDFDLSSGPPAVPTLTGPVATTDNTRPTLTWSEVNFAVRYDLWVRNLTTGQDQVIRQQNLTTNSFRPATALPEGQYRFWVEAHDDLGNRSGWSASRDFTIFVPRLLSPSSTVGSRTPTFTWNGLATAHKYDLWVDNLSTGQSQVIRQQDLTATFFVPTTPLTPGTYRAWIRVFFTPSQASSWSVPIDFVVPATASLPQQSSPINIDAAEPFLDPSAEPGIETDQVLTAHAIDRLPVELGISDLAAAEANYVVTIGDEPQAGDAPRTVDPIGALLLAEASAATESAPSSEQVDSAMAAWPLTDWWSARRTAAVQQNRDRDDDEREQAALVDDNSSHQKGAALILPLLINRATQFMGRLRKSRRSEEE
jgi:hypothetical protein